MEYFDAAEVDRIKQRLTEINQRSRFIIIEISSVNLERPYHIVTNIKNYQGILADAETKFDIKIVRDLLPITDNLARWAINQRKLDKNSAKHGQIETIRRDLYYTDEILEENKLTKNGQLNQLGDWLRLTD